MNNERLSYTCHSCGMIETPGRTKRVRGYPYCDKHFPEALIYSTEVEAEKTLIAKIVYKSILWLQTHPEHTLLDAYGIIFSEIAGEVNG